ncbi:MAG TPA: hypothetical protein VF194_13515 [Ferrovibrio sp.]|uniref:hypothetical protein n=1 Tax=Ferrovibrio sp. TaxID=1917215 RepID=UPI002ED56EB8
MSVVDLLKQPVYALLAAGTIAAGAGGAAYWYAVPAAPTAASAPADAGTGSTSHSADAVQIFPTNFDVVIETGVKRRRQAPHALTAHPSDEHLLPLYVALGAATPRQPAERLHASFAHGTLAMDSYLFH